MPGGFVLNPPIAVQEAVKRQLLTLPIERFNSIASMYHTERDHTAESPKKVRERMERISRMAFDLSIELSTLSEEATDAIFEGAMRFGIADASVFPAMLDLISNAARHSEVARMHLNAGAGPGALSALVSRLAGLLEGYGITIDAKPRGDLVFITKSVLDAYPTQSEQSNEPKDTSGKALKAVQRHLDRMASGEP